MCGFAGFTGCLDDKEKIIDRMMSLIVHRGPDSSGEYIDSDFAVGFRRLSIIDIADGSQPMYNEDKSIILTFNGEIYNFEELKSELETKGHTFHTRCDSEVLIHGYEEFGSDLVKRLRGMFSFALWDKNKKTLFCARDPFGIKPFYYSVLDNGSFLFGSEIKCFLVHPDFKKQVNEKALRPYLTFQYSAIQETFFRGVFKLPPAHCLTYSDGKLEIERYWDIDFHDDNAAFEECVELLDKTIHESVKAHKISDVPVGAFLSGGVDSSYITACLMPDKTFSVGFDFDRFNETNEAEELSKLLGINNYKKMISADECFDAFSDIQFHMDEPQSNPSSVPLYFLSKLAAEHVTVVLSGEGADEIFAGYEWYDESDMMARYKKIPQFIRRFAAKVSKKMPYFKGRDFIIKSSGVPEDYFIGQALVFPEEEALGILNEKYKSGPSVREITAPIYKRVKDKDELVKKQYLDLTLWLPGDILLKADKMSMAHSLELRVPYLDKVVMSMAQGIPSKYKINRINTKYVMRQAANRTLPDEWANRTKMGFPVPIRYWLREQKYYDIVKDYFSSEYANEFFQKDSLTKLLDDHFENRKNNARKIWTIFTFLVWYKRFFIDFDNY